MKLIVKFDIEELGVFIPDGYIYNVNDLRNDFLMWCYDQPDTFLVTKTKVPAFSISQEKFIQYLNEVLLRNSTERAYYIDIRDIQGKRIKSIKF